MSTHVIMASLRAFGAKMDELVECVNDAKASIVALEQRVEMLSRHIDVLQDSTTEVSLHVEEYASSVASLRAAQRADRGH